MDIFRRFIFWGRNHQDVDEDDSEDDSQSEMETDIDEDVHSPRPGDLLRYAKLVDTRNEPNKGFFTVSPSKCREPDHQTPPRPTRAERHPLPLKEIGPLKLVRPWVSDSVPDEEQKVLGLRWPYTKDQSEFSPSGEPWRGSAYGRNTVTRKRLATAEPDYIYKTPELPKPMRILFKDEKDDDSIQTVTEQCSFVEEIWKMDRDLYDRCVTVFTGDRDVCPATAKRLKRRRLDEDSNNVGFLNSAMEKGKTWLSYLL